MANVFTCNPMYIDGTGSASGTFAIKSIQFTGVSAGDELVIKTCPITAISQNPITVIDIKVSASASTAMFTPAEPIQCSPGIKINTISSGGIALIQV